ncbi:hypothetical protein [Microbacterium sp. NPDC077486]|uniref:hypothetical protein n=1 Tax=Microbacterium sp. NPDC077486 TaxID=3154766 RepID=UPI0034366B93
MIWDSWTAGIWASVLGTMVAALIGIVGLVAVLIVEASSRYKERLNSALGSVVVALADRARELDEWSSPPLSLNDGFPQQQMEIQQRAGRRDEPGGPLDTTLHAAAEVASLAATRWWHRKPVSALADATFDLKLAVVAWQIAYAGRMAADVRRWRTGVLSRRKFIAAMRDY